MITISLCMIVRNEEAVLDRCLSSLAHLMDEIIIVDTGSTDRTKEIASKYTNLIYDFEWCDDFSAARNFAFSKASKEYIYAPDADEMLDEKNQKRFLQLKECMVPEIEIVQMHYLTQSQHNTTQNYNNELRPKLFKRIREFVWIDPVHETVRLDPVVFDSDVEILHLPQASHGKRDFEIFEKNLEKGISNRLVFMYAKELYKCGDLKDLEKSLSFFESRLTDSFFEQEANIIMARYLRLIDDATRFQQMIIGQVDLYEYSEICCEIGEYCLKLEDYQVAEEWFKRAISQAYPVLDIESTGPVPFRGLAEVRRHQGRFEEAEEYEKRAEQWELPEEE